jgi:hypothetical protein
MCAGARVAGASLGNGARVQFVVVVVAGAIKTVRARRVLQTEERVANTGHLVTCNWVVYLYDEMVLFRLRSHPQP